jgi:DNA primase
MSADERLKTARLMNEALEILGPILARGMEALRYLEQRELTAISEHIQRTGKLPPLPRFD